MNRRNMLTMYAAAAFGLALLASDGVGAPKAKINKSQLVGDWALTSINATNAVVQNRPGDGYIVFERSGRFSFAVLSANVPKFASNNRNTGTADENKAAVQGSISYFGTYSVNEGDGTLTFHIERCSYPNERHRPAAADYGSQCAGVQIHQSHAFDRRHRRVRLETDEIGATEAARMEFCAGGADFKPAPPLPRKPAMPIFFPPSYGRGERRLRFKLSPQQL